MKIGFKDLTYCIIICILMTYITLQSREKGTPMIKIQPKSEIQNVFTYDMLFNMHVGRQTISDTNYNWIYLNETDVVCLYGKPKEGDSDRNICLLAQQWLSQVRSFTILTDTNIDCDRAITVRQSTIGVPDSLKNPFSVSWFVRFINLTKFVLINDDDLMTMNTTKIISNPLYFKDKLILHNEGDLAQYRVLKKLYSYGGDFIHVPTSPVLHGPMLVHQSDIFEAHKLLKLDRLSECRDGEIWSLTAAVGALRAIKGEARYAPNNYHYYTQLRSETIIPKGYWFYCLNDGPELIKPDVLKTKMIETFNVNKNTFLKEF